MVTRFSDTAHAAMRLAREAAEAVGHKAVGTEHLLLGLLGAGGVAAKVLSHLDVDLEGVQNELAQRAQEAVAGGKAKQQAFSPALKAVIDRAHEQALLSGADRMATEHLLLGLIRESECPAVKVLEVLGVDIEDLRAALLHRMDASQFG